MQKIRNCSDIAHKLFIQMLLSQTVTSLSLNLFAEEEELDEDYEEEDNVAEESVKENGLLEMLRQHREDGDEGEEYFGYDEEEY
jgi:hypothetical protein